MEDSSHSSFVMASHRQVTKGCADLLSTGASLIPHLPLGSQLRSRVAIVLDSSNRLLIDSAPLSVVDFLEQIMA
jgi:hypothetical protein